MTPDIANPTFVDAPRPKALFHPGEQAFHPFASLEGKLLSEGN
jgi:hypothetical protein